MIMTLTEILLIMIFVELIITNIILTKGKEK